MISRDDIFGVCACSEAEIDAIALHEHVPDVVAAEIAEYLMHTSNGVAIIRGYIVDDIYYARLNGYAEQVDLFRSALNQFDRQHYA